MFESYMFLSAPPRQYPFKGILTRTFALVVKYSDFINVNGMEYFKLAEHSTNLALSKM